MKILIMQAFEANFATVVSRFYIMMAIIIAAGFTGIWALGLLALPVFLTGVLGFGRTNKVATTSKMKVAIRPIHGLRQAA